MSVPHTAESKSDVQPRTLEEPQKSFLRPAQNLPQTRTMADEPKQETHKLNKETITEADWQALGISGFEPFGMLNPA